MSFVKSAFPVFALALLSACGALGENLFPSGEDRRQVSGSGGGANQKVGQSAPELILSDVDGATFTLSDETAAGKTVVLYFTMWCPVCDAHQQHLQGAVVPAHPSVEFCVIDYVSGSAAAAKTAQDSAGWSGAPFRVLADDGAAVAAFAGTMGTTVVIDKNGIVRMSEDYKDGTALLALLEELR